MKKIELTKGKHAIVDEEDFDFIKRLSPTLMQREDGSFDAVVCVMGIKTKAHNAYLRHFLLKPKHNQVVIHKNGDRLDFRKSNLTTAGYSVHVHKGRKREKCSSKYKGVSYVKRRKSKPWHAYITDRKYPRFNLGYFETEEEAALAYNEKARELYGVVAYQNKIEK